MKKVSGTDSWRGKSVRSQFLSRLCDFPELPLPPSEKSQAQQPDSDPDQLAKPPEQREGDAGDVAVAEGLEQQIAAVVRTKAAWDDGRTRSMKNESPQTGAVAVRAPTPRERNHSPLDERVSFTSPRSCFP